MAKSTICILFGGRSAEHEVSISSARSIYNNLNPEKFEIITLYIDKSGRWRTVDSPHLSIEELNAGPFRSFLPWFNEPSVNAVKADVYFPILHGPYGEDGTIQGFFEICDVPYVGAGVMASAIGMDKAIAKAVFQQKNLPVVKHTVLCETEWMNEPEACLDTVRKEYAPPIFVKPANLGSSVGITKVGDFSRLASAIKEAFLFDRKILVEEGIQGRELECSVLGNEDPRASLPGEIIPFNDFYDYKDKYIDGKTSYGIPAELPSNVIKEVQRISIEAFKSIEGTGMARVDFFLQDQTQKVYLNEINTIPGFTEISMYPKLWEVSGLSYSRLLEELVSLALEKFGQKKSGEKKFSP
ncbi:MAG: D-alanine--D-alanine ligase [Candidatus Aminicenantes bacterium]|nr:D-alanine--D-alanine ligase [Candidatus Aminicenantes bacterium]